MSLPTPPLPTASPTFNYTRLAGSWLGRILTRPPTPVLREVEDRVDQSGPARLPPVVMIWRDPGKDYLSVDALARYLPGVRMIPGDVEVSGIWWCPSTRQSTKQEINDVVNFWRYFNSSYSYFGRVDLW